MPAIDRLLGRRFAKRRHLNRIAVSIGPGDSAALAASVAVAKMLAETTGAKLIPVRSSSVAAWAVAISSAPAIVCLAADGETVHGTLVPERRAVGDWWDRVGGRGLRELLDPSLHPAVERRETAGSGWITGSFALGPITVRHIELLRPRTLIADGCLPSALTQAAIRLGVKIVEPIFGALSTLQISEYRPAVPAEAFAPLDSLSGPVI